ncbi:uncharacterized protein LOC142589079 [Dermacentor variabilis]|uniref:uncharacterized protein LOC142589079 n=1 Tax=Dermacentor variabilis TaxID=34621 RepID=UPI003F5B164A
MKNFSVQEAYWMLPPTLGIKRRPVFSLGFHDYVHRPHGLFDCFEIYILFQGAGAGCYVISCISIVQAVQKMSSLCIVGLSTGGLHALHFTYAFYKMYIEPRGYAWF